MAVFASVVHERIYSPTKQPSDKGLQPVNDIPLRLCR